MTSITVMYWNIQNFGDENMYKGNYEPLCNFIAQTAFLADADLLFIQELKFGAVGLQRLQLLQRSLCNLPAPHNNWHYDWIMGGIKAAGATPPYARFDDLNWSGNHHEGYALFWNQNIAKFAVTPAAPIVTPGTNAAVANTQSAEVRTRGDTNSGVLTYGLTVDVDIAVPAGTHPFILPTGTVAGGDIRSGGQVVLANGHTSNGPIALNAGDALPADTQMGPTGLELNHQLYRRNPVLIPGGFVNGDSFSLPAAGALVLPQHALSLVITGRDITHQGLGVNFVPAGPNHWEYLKFLRGAGFGPVLREARRAAHVILSVESPALTNAAQKLVPVLAYHAPVAQAGQAMLAGSFSKQMYVAYDGTHWIANDRAVIGGDYNAKLKPSSYNYLAYTDDIGPAGGAGGGAGCNNSGGPAIRVNAAGVDPPSNNPNNRTTVQLRSPIIYGTPITSNQLDDYRFLAIDNAFYHGFTPVQTPAAATGNLYDLLAAVTGGAGASNIPAAVIQQFLNIPVFMDIYSILRGVSPPPVPNTPNVLDPTRLLLDLTAGIFQDPHGGPSHGTPPAARRAAEFVHLCISDHLPILFKMDL